MFFLLSKTLNYLVMPLSIIAVCFIMSLLLRSAKWRRWSRIGGLALLFLFTNEFIANEVMKRWEVPTQAFDDMRPHRLGIVLTGAMIPLLKPDDRVYFTKGADRVVHTVQLYKSGLIKEILISGGSGRLIDIHEREADRFRDVMILMGIPDSVIMVENMTRNTHESAIAVKAILREHGYAADECLLITSAFHMRRSLACYRKAGLAVDSFSTDFYAHHHGYYFDSFVVPKVEALVIWHKLVREWVGMVAYRMAGYV